MSAMQSGDIAVQGPVGSLASRWRRIAFVAVAATGLALTLAWFSTPQYRGEARLLIEPRTSGGAADRGEDYANNQIELIRSADMLERVAAGLDLARLPEFDEAGRLSLVSRALIVVGLKRDPNETPAQDRVLDVLRDKLRVYGAERFRVIVIEFSSSDPGLAAAIPNAIADAYVSVRPEAAQQRGLVAAAPSGEGLREAEARLADFRAGLATGADGGSSAAVSDLTDELARVRAERREAEAMAQSLRDVIDGGSIDALPDDLALGGLRQLREQQVQLKADIAELSITLLDNHPRLRGVRAQLADIEAQIAAEARAAQASLTTAIEAAQKREGELTAELDGLQAASTLTEGQEAELRALEREVESQRELLASASGATSAVGAVAADARIFARAIVPSEPYFPKFGQIAGVAFAGSLALMTALTLLGSLLSNRRGPAMNNARPEPIAEVAMPPAHEQVVLDEQPSDNAFSLYGEVPEPAAEDVEPVREQAVSSEDDFEATLSDSEEGASTLGEVGIETTAERLIASGATRAIFVSPEGDEAAAAAVLVAREIADAGLRVLLLDLTASGAASRPMLDSVTYPGITNLMAAEAQFTDVIHSDHYSDCHVMPVGTADPARAMRAADRLPIIMESLTTAYDLVIVECGPAGADAIRRLVAPGAEILVSVIEPNEDVAEAADALVAGGYGELTLVTPVGYRSPSAPIPGRSAA